MRFDKYLLEEDWDAILKTKLKLVSNRNSTIDEFWEEFHQSSSQIKVNTLDLLLSYESNTLAVIDLKLKVHPYAARLAYIANMMGISPKDIVHKCL